SKEALELLTSYSWPGNVRQLENAMFRAVVLADGPQLTVTEFPQIAAHVEGFRAAIPPAPAPVDRRPVITGPAMLGAESTIPRTVEVGASASAAPPSTARCASSASRSGRTEGMAGRKRHQPHCAGRGRACADVGAMRWILAPCTAHGSAAKISLDAL